MSIHRSVTRGLSAQHALHSFSHISHDLVDPVEGGDCQIKQCPPKYLIMIAAHRKIVTMSWNPLHTIINCDMKKMKRPITLYRGRKHPYNVDHKSPCLGSKCKPPLALLVSSKVGQLCCYCKICPSCALAVLKCCDFIKLLFSWYASSQVNVAHP